VTAGTAILVRLQVYRIGKVRVLSRRLEFDPVTDRNCVAARRGGEHRKVKEWSETQVNSIRPVVAASQLGNGEAEVPKRTDGTLMAKSDERGLTGS
jgi:hypothetical protein